MNGSSTEDQQQIQQEQIEAIQRQRADSIAACRALHLTDRDIADHEQRWRITPNVLTAARIVRWNHDEASEHGRWQGCDTRDFRGIVYPCLDPFFAGFNEHGHSDLGQQRSFYLRRDNPERDANGKEQNKYLTPVGDRHHLFYAPGAEDFVDDVSVPALIVEAPKSALAAIAVSWRANQPTTRPLLAIATGGCWGHRGKVGFAAQPDGSHKPEKDLLPDFHRVKWQGREAFIAFDSNAVSNEAVRAGRADLASKLTELGALVRIVTIPNEPGINGPDDYIGKHGDQAFWKLLADAESFSIEQREVRGSDKEQLIRLVRSAADLFHDSVGNPYATVNTNSGLAETFPIGSEDFADWMLGRFYATTADAASASAIKDATATLRAHPKHSGPERIVAIRVAEHDGAIYIDLADASRRIVKVTAKGWAFVAECPVRFCRTKDMLPLPIPVAGGTIDELRPFSMSRQTTIFA